SMTCHSVFSVPAPPPPELSPLSLHDALPISEVLPGVEQRGVDLGRGEIHEARLMQHGENRAALARAERAGRGTPRRRSALGPPPDRKSTRLNSSHQIISYAVFCLKKKKKKQP